MLSDNNARLERQLRHGIVLIWLFVVIAYSPPVFISLAEEDAVFQPKENEYRWYMSENVHA